MRRVLGRRKGPSPIKRNSQPEYIKIRRMLGRRNRGIY